MTDRERKMIEGYLPHERDPDLKKFEYYVRDTADRVHKVFIADIFPGDMKTPDDEYGVYEVGTKRRIDSGWDNPFRGFTMGRLYDNRQDCRDATHEWYSNWEHLRKLQQESEKSDGGL